MESKPDIVAIISAVCVAAYAAVAIRYVTHYDLGFSFREIRSAALVIAVVIAAFIAIDFLRERFGKAQ
jgi:hypothetical protein